MKIAQIITQMESGGAQRVAYLLHKEFESRGHESELCFLYLKRPAYQQEPHISCLLGKPPNVFDYFRIVARLHKWLRSGCFDAIIAHTHYANILALGLGRILGVPTRVAVQHSPVQTYPGASQILDWLCGSTGIYSNQIAVSDAVVDSMSGYPANYRRIVSRVYNGIQSDQATSKLIPTDDQFSSLGPKILHVGRFSTQKNHAALLEVLGRLPQAKLVLVGDGELKSDIEKRVHELDIRERVTFLGEIGPLEVRKVMRSCDLFMFPSIHEAMPMALLEAMATGMPIVASDIPANRELLGGTGLLRQIDAEQFADAATSLLADNQFAAELGRKAAARASEFTVTAMADGYERVLQVS
jgi:glycosyltransferase involved in cell wall biosynthesis